MEKAFKRKLRLKLWVFMSSVKINKMHFRYSLRDSDYLLLIVLFPDPDGLNHLAPKSQERIPECWLQQCWNAFTFLGQFKTESTY